MPESDVVAVPVQVATWHWSPVQPPPVDEPGQTLAVPPAPQVMPLVQLPQLSTPPQPLPIVPQYCPPIGVQVTGVQLGSTQRLATPPDPQAMPPGQLPQSSVPPQPSPIFPQYSVPVAGLQVSGTQPGEAQIPELHWLLDEQLPQVSVRPQPSPMLPQ